MMDHFFEAMCRFLSFFVDIWPGTKRPLRKYWPWQEDP